MLFLKAQTPTLTITDFASLRNKNVIYFSETALQHAGQTGAFLFFLYTLFGGSSCSNPQDLHGRARKTQLEPLVAQVQEQVKTIAANVEEQIKPMAANVQDSVPDPAH